MKKLFKSPQGTLFIACVILTFGACKKSFFYSGINDNPSAVTEGQLVPSVLLNGGELSMGYPVGGDLSRYTSLFVQSVHGYNRQFAGYDQYIFSTEDFDVPWENVYSGGLNNYTILKTLSDAKGYKYYSGISRVLLAYEFGLASDLWGDIPLTEGLEGSANLKPAYDKQQSIYPYLQSTLDTAIQLLSGTDGAVSPGADDFIYNGNPANWIAFAYALKARYYLHLSKIDNSYADNVLKVLPNAISGSARNALVPFFNNETQSNPWYQYIEQRSDISYIGGYFNQTLLSLNDPRAGAYIDQANDVLTPLLAGISSPVTLLSYTEVLFMKAEVLSAKNDPSAVAVYDSAVASAFNDAGVTMPSNYLVANALSGTTHAERLPQIILQKYLSLFTQTEPFTDWRRTGYPTLTPNAGTQIPRRFLYPLEEVSLNKQNVPQGTNLFTRVWWDQ